MGFHTECAEAAFTQEAKDSLTEKLKDGKRVGRCDLHDLLDCELNSERYRIVRDDLMQILTAQNDSRPHLADQFIEGLIERYLDSNPELVADEAANERALEEDFREWDSANG